MSINSHCHVLQLHLMPFGGVCKRARDDSSNLECEIGIDRLTQGSVCVRLEDSNDVLRGVIVRMSRKRLLPDWSICIVVGWMGRLSCVLCVLEGVEENGGQPCAEVNRRSRFQPRVKT